VGAIVSGQPEISSEVSDALSQYVIPFPEAGLYYQYQFSGAPVRIGDAFRIGGGAIAFASPDIPDGIAFAYYLGLKFAIKF
ncbi:MAG TPA: hypothetical protein PKO22_02960, partial [Treponemataceae bacterium]|nr:hypothetical protein [Treponemataceae bacterium]